MNKQQRKKKLNNILQFKSMNGVNSTAEEIPILLCIQSLVVVFFFFYLSSVENKSIDRPSISSVLYALWSGLKRWTKQAKKNTLFFIRPLVKHKE